MKDISPEPASVLPEFRPLFMPQTVAVIGASASGVTHGNRFIRLLKEAGFAGRIFPIHPGAGQIEGLPAYPSLAQAPEAVDYAYLMVPASRVVQALSGTAGRLRFAQVMASAEPGAQHSWENELQALARREGFRLIGPNCMGTHSPRGRYTFMEKAEMAPGAVGIACQSGGLGMDILRRGQNLGLRFSGLVTIGNAIDVDAADLLEYYLADPETAVAGLYIEDVKDGARFQSLLRRNMGRKPVVLLVGGLTGPGRAAAASHTGAMGGSAEAWRALSRQTGAILTESLDEFLDMLQMCLWLVPRPGAVASGVTLFGNGGGTSVLATDALDRSGFALARPDPAARQELDAITLPPGASLENPIDLPASVLKEEDGRVTARILGVNARRIRPYATIVHFNLPVIMAYRHIPDFLPNLLDAVFGDPGGDGDGGHKLLVLRSDRSEEADAWRRNFRAEAVRRGVPSFDEVLQAVQALAAYRDYEGFLERRRGGPETEARGNRR